MLRMLHRPSETQLEQARVQFFNWAHSPEVFLAGVDLAVFLHRDPRVPDSKAISGRAAVLAWPVRPGPRTHGRSFQEVFVPMENLVSRHLKVLRRIRSPADVILAKPDLPRQVWEEINKVGYFREIPGAEHVGQVYGWPEESLDAARKTRLQHLQHNPTLGLLPRPNARVDGSDCLLLVEVNYQWQVLSEIGLHGRTGGQQLLRGEPVYLVSHELPGWAIYEIASVRRMKWPEVRAVWGAAVADRARDDADEPIVRAKLIEPAS